MAKFDWNKLESPKPLGGDAPKAGKFSWDSMAEANPKAVEKAEPKTTASMAALEAFGNGASLGYLPQLQAIASRLTPNPNADLDRKLRDQGFDIQQSKPTYAQERDANIKRLQTQTEEHPVAAGLGSVGGSLASGAAASAMAPINAASRLGRAVQAAKGGAVVGALANPGDKEEETQGMQIGERLTGALTGGALGGLSQGALEAISKAANSVANLPKSLSSKAEERAFKSAGAMLKDYRLAAGQGRINELGRYMLDNDLVKPGMSVADVAKAAESLTSEHGAEIRQILNRLDDAGAGAPTHDALAEIIEGQAKPLAGLKTARPSHDALQDLATDIRTMGKEPKVNVAKGEVSSLTGRGTEYLTDPVTGDVMAKFRNGKLVTEGVSAPVSAESAAAKTAVTPPSMPTKEIAGTFQEAQAVKKFIDDQVEASGGWKALEPTEKNKALRQAYKAISEKLEESATSAAGTVGDKGIGEAYAKAKGAYRNAKDISKVANDQALRQNANRFLSPSDYLTGATGAIAGAASGENIEDKLSNAAIGGTLGLANKAARSYGTPLVSQAFNKAGRALSRAPIIGDLGDLAAPTLAAAERAPVAASNVARIMSRPKLERAVESLQRVAEDDSNSQPKGEAKWARTGLQKLKQADKSGRLSDQVFVDDLLKSPQGRRLLIEASDLEPGSRAFTRVMQRINELKGPENDSSTRAQTEVLRRQREPARRR